MHNISHFSSNHVISFFKERILPSLTSQQKKITFIVISIFAGLAGVYCICRYVLKSMREIKPLSQKRIEEEVDKQLKKIEDDMLCQILLINPKSDQIKAAKSFMSIKDSKTSFSSVEIIEKPEDSSLDATDFLFQKIESIFDEFKNFRMANYMNVPKEISWGIVLKYKDEKFHTIKVTLKSTGENDYDLLSHETNKGIQPENISKFCNPILQALGREVKPQLNDQLEFI